MKSIEQEWNEFAVAVLPPSVKKNSIQYKEMRRAFFAGSICVYHGLSRVSEEDESVGVDYLNRLKDELDRFARQVLLEIREHN